MLARDHGPWTNLEFAFAGDGVLLEDLGAGDVGGHEVGRELDAIELEVDGAGEGLDHEGLGESRDADHEAVASGEDGGEQVLDDLVLADDDAGDLGEAGAWRTSPRAGDGGGVGGWGGFGDEGAMGFPVGGGIED